MSRGGRLPYLALVLGLALRSGTALAAVPSNVRLVRDIRPGVASADPAELFAFGETLLFAADDGVHGMELWRSDGTPQGTVLVQDINPGPDSSFPTNFASVNGIAFFTADDGVHGLELWGTDGTAAGTKLVKDINPGAGDGVFRNLVPLGDAVYFVGYEPTTGLELRGSDGTADGTWLVKDIYPGPGPPPGQDTCMFCPECGYQSPRFLATMGGALYFGAADSGSCAGVYDTELWRSTGKEAETWRVKDISPGAWGSIPENLVAVDGALYFRAAFSLFRTDGTEQGTQPVVSAPEPVLLVAAASRLFFTAFESLTAYNVDLWRTAPAEPGASLVGRISPQELAPCGTRLVAVADNLLMQGADLDHGCELWRSDGTARGTSILTDIYPGSGQSNPDCLSLAPNGMVYFRAADGVSAASGETELWRTDGTAQAARLVADLRAGPLGSSPGCPVAAGRYLYFSADDGHAGRELWAVDLDVLFVDGFEGP